MRKGNRKLEYPENIYCTIFGEAECPNLPLDTEETLEYILKTFSQQEMDFFMLKYKNKMNFREISNKYGNVSPSRVGAIVANTVRKLCHISRRKVIKIGREAYLNSVAAEKEKEKKMYNERIEELNKLIQEYTEEIAECRDKLNKLEN